MTLNLLTRREYFSNGNFKYYCRTRMYGPEAPYEVNWQVWCDKSQGYVNADAKTQAALEKEYLSKK